MMEKIILPERKIMRYEGYDYANCGIYFVTICTKDSKNFFGKLEPVIDENMELITGAYLKRKKAADIAEEAWHKIPEIYPFVEDDCFVIMPDHIHGILIFNEQDENKKTLSEIISAYKSVTTRQFQKTYNRKDSLWQKNYYDTIIENEKQYLIKKEYIENNPLMKVINQLENRYILKE